MNLTAPGAFFLKGGRLPEASTFRVQVAGGESLQDVYYKLGLCEGYAGHLKA